MRMELLRWKEIVRPRSRRDPISPQIYLAPQPIAKMDLGEQYE